jgi:GNAT superfamily N-acetyltransferase
VSPIRIQRARVEDIPALLALLREMATYERVPGAVQINEERARQYLFGAEAIAEAWLGWAGGEPVAYCILYECFASYAGRPVLYIEDVFVREEARGQGSGKEFMRYIARLAIERGCVRVAWSVLEWNRPAIEFYQRLGAERETPRMHFELSGEALRRLAE